MDRYLGGDPVTEDALLEDLHRAMSRGTFFPVVAACSSERRGLRRAARPDRARGFPAPSEHPSPDTFTPDGSGRRRGGRVTRTVPSSQRSSRPRATPT